MGIIRDNVIRAKALSEIDVKGVYLQLRQVALHQVLIIKPAKQK